MYWNDSLAGYRGVTARVAAVAAMSRIALVKTEPAPLVFLQVSDYN
jgi:hypothetical protein